MFSGPHYITENINGDVCVSDWSNQAVVVMDKSSQHRFSYTGQWSGFEPYGICTDVLGHILVCDIYSNTVHLLDQDAPVSVEQSKTLSCEGNSSLEIFFSRTVSGVFVNRLLSISDNGQTYKKEDSDALLYDVHFWIGKYSTQDEYATAAYKTVELDTYLDDAPVQHREIPRMEKYIDDTDVYILDLGLHIYQYNGQGSNKDERVRRKALQYVNSLRAERSGKAVKTTVLDQVAGGTGVFFRHLYQTEGEDFESEEDMESTDVSEHELYRLSDADGSLKFSLEKEGPVGLKDFDGNDVFIFDTKQELFVWVGNHTTHEERKNALIYAHNYLKKTSHPLIPVSCLNEGAENKSFSMALTA
uniref:Severin n=1 Tax=Magallana gigas TaxID=29159 RepID=K1PKS0_MAGGI